MSDELKRTILCVDDEKDVTDSLYDTFMDGYHVRTANSAKEALTIFDEEDISLVISDQRMPEMEGTELLAKIHGKKPICKKILLTGYADINAAIDAINTGNVDRYFSKPWDDEELIKVVEDLLNMYKIDAFIEKMLADGKRLKSGMEQGKRTTELFENFLDSCHLGICVVGKEGAIEYLNKKGLEIIRYWDFADIRGKDFKNIFLIDDVGREKCHEKYLKKDRSRDMLDIKRGDGSNARVPANLTFTLSEGVVQVCGIVFEPS